MSRAVFVLVALSVACAVLAIQCDRADIPVPLFAWSSQHPLNAVPQTQRDLERGLQGLIYPLNGEPLASGTPEVVIIFAHHRLRSDEVSRFAEAHSGVSTGGAISNFKSAFETASSKVHSPLYHAAMNRRAISEFARYELAHIASVNSHAVSIVASPDATETTVATNGVMHTTFENVVALMKEHNVADNKKADVVVIQFAAHCNDIDAKLAFAQDDALVGEVLAAAGSNYVAVLTADGATAPSTSGTVRKTRDLLNSQVVLVEAYNGTNITVQVMSPPVAAALLTTLFGLGIAMFAFCCIFNMQTPTRFELPDKSLLPAAQH